MGIKDRMNMMRYRVDRMVILISTLLGPWVWLGCEVSVVILLGKYVCLVREWNLSNNGLLNFWLSNWVDRFE